MIGGPCVHPVVDRSCGRPANSDDLGLPLCWQHEESILQIADTRPGRSRRRRESTTYRGSGYLVYYVQRPDGAIKIGTTSDLAGRLKTLRSVSPVEVLATHLGAFKAEHALHRQFAAHRLHGEWFAPADALLTHVARFTEPAA